MTGVTLLSRPAGRSLAVPFVFLLLMALIPGSTWTTDPLDFDLPDGSGHFYRQANGRGGAGDTGYAITNDDGIPFWDEFRRLGGVQALGYPVSHRFVWDGFVVQAMQKVVFQWRPETGTVAFVNVLDRMHDLGHDDWLLVFRQTPEPFDTSPDTNLSWNEVLQRHWEFLDTNAAIKARYWSDPAPLDHFGLPMSYRDMGNSFVVRAQRAVFQYWKEDVPWAKKGEVTLANSGDLAKEAGVFPSEAITPLRPSATPAPAPQPLPGPSRNSTHDWRSPNFTAVVGGQIFDPGCVPLRSVGINAPNLLYRPGQEETLKWMHKHQIRWVRVFATGHAIGSERGPRDAATAVDALRGFLARVNAFNAAHDPSEAIYVLVSLTDYYPPGVPGDRFAYDHPTFDLTPVLPAPWYRAGVREFDFEQEHDQGVSSRMPNYEVYYKPWVRHVVASLSDNRVILGWQLGNELKARGSPRNGISSAQAYGWYLDFTRDMVDIIRSLDRNHLVFMGAQYIAELVDWEYRPQDELDPDRVPEYHRLVQRMVENCGQHCWNVWSLTYYDFNLYPLDDAVVFNRAGVAVVAAEYGFTLDAPAEMRRLFGGNRATATLSGFEQAWRDIDGQWHQRQLAAAKLFDDVGLDGISPWGSPAPGLGAEFDTDSRRGITGTPDESSVWAAWSQVAQRLENANRAAGPSHECRAYASPAHP